MKNKNSIFIATSLDGYIADKNGGIDWLHLVPNPNSDGMGYLHFIDQVDALIMGRVTFETVCNFDVPWPYEKMVFVLSNSLDKVPQTLMDKVRLVNGPLNNVLNEINKQGYNQLYIDGGTTIQNFLQEDLIDEMIITKIPILLGGGSTLFSELKKPLEFDLVDSKVYLNQITQSHYRRKR